MSKQRGRFFKSNPGTTIVQTIDAAATPERIGSASLLVPWFVVSTQEASAFYIGDSGVTAAHTEITSSKAFVWSCDGLLTDLYEWYIKAETDSTDVIVAYGLAPVPCFE